MCQCQCGHSWQVPTGFYWHDDGASECESAYAGVAPTVPFGLVLSVLSWSIDLLTWLIKAACFDLVMSPPAGLKVDALSRC